MEVFNLRPRAWGTPTAIDSDGLLLGWIAIIRKSSTYVHASNRAEHTKSIEQPDHSGNYNNAIEKPFDLAIHGDVVVNQPKQHANNDQRNNKRN